jgi:sigma-B regulation protein RsbU (phosphoserine phosphatase)
MTTEEEKKPIRILLVEDNQEFANLVELFLRKQKEHRFQVVWRENGPAALEELASDKPFDLILMDYFLPGQNGLEITRAIQEKGISTPVVFLTVNKDFDLAVEVMKLGVEDYLVKEEISTPVLPRTIVDVIERKKLKDELDHLEISQKRLEAIQEHVVQITGQIRYPLDVLRKHFEGLSKLHENDDLKGYLGIIRENLDRIDKKMAQLKELKADKTVTYVQDIKMLDLSE